MSLDETRLHTLLGKMVNDMGAAAVAPLVILGDKLGLYKSLAAAGPPSHGTPRWRPDLYFIPQ